MNNYFDSFGEGLIFYFKKIKPFLTKNELHYLEQLDPQELTKWIESIEERYNFLSKKAQYEVEPFFEGCKIIIFLDKNDEAFTITEKINAPFCLEQIFDENDQVISETIKENPYYKK